MNSELDKPPETDDPNNDGFTGGLDYGPLNADSGFTAKGATEDPSNEAYYQLSLLAVDAIPPERC